jgi:tRNA modification GTPase
LDTIAAISTPIGLGGIAVIRMSGDRALEIADRVFMCIATTHETDVSTTPITPKKPSAMPESTENNVLTNDSGNHTAPKRTVKKPSQMPGYTCAYGRVIYKNEFLDECILTVFKNPRSYTGEDVVEISVHGGVFTAHRVLTALCESGARLAHPGEFTERAFLAGKMSLMQAEAVMDIINANGEAELRSALAAKDGVLYKKIRACTDKLTFLLAKLGVWADYPDDNDNISDISLEKILEVIDEVDRELRALSDGFRVGELIKTGIPLCIAGKPNVGKSSLMNLLSGTRRSIVTAIPGTTRDVIENNVKIGDYTFRIFDTAGIHETADEIEKTGTDLAKSKIDEAEIILAVFDSSAPLSADDEEIIRLCRFYSAGGNAANEENAEQSRNAAAPCENAAFGENYTTANGLNRSKHVIALLNKSDKTSKIDEEYIKSRFETVVKISAANGDGLSDLTQAITNLPELQHFGASPVILNARQQSSALRAEKLLEDVRAAALSHTPFDALTVLIDAAARALTDLTGESLTVAVAESIFENFCVGK